jgi:hypothetical protein
MQLAGDEPDKSNLPGGQCTQVLKPAPVNANQRTQRDIVVGGRLGDRSQESPRPRFDLSIWLPPDRSLRDDSFSGASIL